MKYPSPTITLTPTPSVTSSATLAEPPLPTEPPPAQLLDARYTYDGDGRGGCTPEPRSGERGNLVKSEVNGVVTYYPSISYQEEENTITKYYSQPRFIEKQMNRGATRGSQRVAMRAGGVLSWLILDNRTGGL